MIERSTVQRLLARDDWYQLTLPAERLDIVRFEDVRRLENIAVDLLTDYADRYWRARRRRWEHGRIEVVTSGPKNNRTTAVSRLAQHGDMG